MQQVAGLTVDLLATRVVTGSPSWKRDDGFPAHYRNRYGAAVAATERHLLVYDHLAPLHVVLLDRAAGVVLGEAGRTGEGPHELRSLTHVAPLTTRDGSPPASFMGFDYALRRVVVINPVPSNDSVIEVGQLQVRGYPDQAYRWRDELLVGGMFAAAPLVRLANRGRESPGGRHPFTAADYPDASARYTANQYVSAVRPDGAAIALAYLFLGRLDVYREDLGPAWTFHAMPPIGPPRLIPVNGRLQWDPARLMAYRSATATERFLYAYLCACPVDDDAEQPGRGEIQVFAWDGALVARLRLDREHTGIAVAPDDSRLYAGFLEPRPGVGEWLLPRFPDGHTAANSGSPIR